MQKVLIIHFIGLQNKYSSSDAHLNMAPNLEGKEGYQLFLLKIVKDDLRHNLLFLIFPETKGKRPVKTTFIRFNVCICPTSYRLFEENMTFVQGGLCFQYLWRIFSCAVFIY